ncbi:MAG TPA: GNAT family N-acetyltransferase [Lysobacter sp.]|nr:GNAT family N-acetyltransferase [Lysobacter sp.]
MSLAIRRASLADLDHIAPLFDAYRRFYSQPGDLPRARAFLHERLQHDESTILLAELDGAAVGFTQLYPMFSSVRTARLWVLNDLFVDDGARRQGVARALLDAAAQFARDNGAAGVMLETAHDNVPARALYRAAGWHEETSQWYSVSFTAADEPLFSYGTLQDEAVQQRLFGRRLDGTPDALVGFRMDWLVERDAAAVTASGVARHPVVHETRAPQDRVPGTLLRVTSAELARVDEYEADDYRRVRVTLASGESAWLYVAAQAP